jgi:ribosomal protein L14E/L6E/L27E
VRRRIASTSNVFVNWVKNWYAHSKRILCTDYSTEEEIKREKAEEARQKRERKATVQEQAQARERAFGAARRGDFVELKDIVEKHDISITSTYKNKQDTLVLAAARSGSIPMVEWLVKRGAPVDALDKEGLGAFHIAASLGHAPLVQYLMDKHPKAFNVSKALPDGRTPLQLAVHSGSADTVQILVRPAPTHDVKNRWLELDGVLTKVDGHEEKKWKAIQEVLRTKVMLKNTMLVCIHLRVMIVHSVASCLLVMSLRGRMR